MYEAKTKHRIYSPSCCPSALPLTGLPSFHFLEPLMFNFYIIPRGLFVLRGIEKYFLELEVSR